MNPLPDSDSSRYPIGVVTRRTGLSADVLRVWERRYAVVTPTRSPGGQRLYSAADLERLRLLRRVVEGGHRIAGVARLATADLERLAAESGESMPGSGSGAMDPAAIGAIHRTAMDAVDELEGAVLEAILKRAALSLATEVWIDDVIAPFLGAVGDRWHEGTISPAHEHLASTTTREVLAWVTRTFVPPPTAPTIVVGTLSGELHELGAMMACVIAAEAGWRVQYLGPNLPADALAAAARQLDARAIAVSMVYPDDADRAEAELRSLCELAAEDMSIIIGGQAAARMDIPGATLAADTAAFRAALSSLTPASAQGSTR